GRPRKAVAITATATTVGRAMGARAALARRRAALVAQVQFAANVRRCCHILADIGLGHAMRATAGLVPARLLARLFRRLGRRILAWRTRLLRLAAGVGWLGSQVRIDSCLGRLFGLSLQLGIGNAPGLVFGLAPGFLFPTLAVGLFQCLLLFGLLRARGFQLAHGLLAFGTGGVDLLLVQRRAL